MYVVVPGAISVKLDSYVKTAGIEVLFNTNILQAVANRKLGVVQMVFYTPGEVKTEGLNLSVEQPAIIMVDKNTLTIADPTEMLEKIVLTLNRRFKASGDNFTASWNETNKVTTIEVILPKQGMAGSSFVIPFIK